MWLLIWEVAVCLFDSDCSTYQGHFCWIRTGLKQIISDNLIWRPLACKRLRLATPATSLAEAWNSAGLGPYDPAAREDVAPKQWWHTLVIWFELIEREFRWTLLGEQYLAPPKPA